MPLHTAGLPLHTAGLSLQTVGLSLHTGGLHVKAAGLPLHTGGLRVKAAGLPLHIGGLHVKAAGCTPAGCRCEPESMHSQPRRDACVTSRRSRRIADVGRIPAGWPPRTAYAAAPA